MTEYRHRTYGSTRIVAVYDDQVSGFNPDLVIYSEAWNEQVDFSQWGQATDRIADVGGTLHRALYQNSLLYTYSLGKVLRQHSRRRPILENRSRQTFENFLSLARRAQASGAAFVCVTQPTRFPRYHRGIDTFDVGQVSQLLDSLQGDSEIMFTIPTDHMSEGDLARFLRDCPLPGRGTFFLDRRYPNIDFGEHEVGLHPVLTDLDDWKVKLSGLLAETLRAGQVIRPHSCIYSHMLGIMLAELGVRAISQASVQASGATSVLATQMPVLNFSRTK